MTTEISLENFIKSLNLTKNQEILLNYNLTGGKLIRKKIFEKNLDLLNNKNDFLDLGFCIEILHAHYLITDDIIDNSELRRGKPSWFALTGFKTLNDASFMLHLVFKILRNYSDHCNYLKILELFNQANLMTWLGQGHDTLDKKINNFDDVLKFYNFDNYSEICKSKTCFYTYVLPINLAFLLCDIKIPVDNEKICKKLSFLMQFQDDYLDFYPEISGKSGTDLEERKVTWYLCKLVEENKYDKIFKEEFLNYLQGGNIDYVKKKSF
ncbi:hypothetical protein GVAV_001895 [Gurleya vavrai]